MLETLICDSQTPVLNVCERGTLARVSTASEGAVQVLSGKRQSEKLVHSGGREHCILGKGDNAKEMGGTVNFVLWVPRCDGGI